MALLVSLFLWLFYLVGRGGGGAGGGVRGNNVTFPGGRGAKPLYDYTIHNNRYVNFFEHLSGSVSTLNTTAQRPSFPPFPFHANTTRNLYVSVRLETYGNTVFIVLGNFLCISLSRKDNVSHFL